MFDLDRIFRVRYWISMARLHAPMTQARDESRLVERADNQRCMQISERLVCVCVCVGRCVSACVCVCVCQCMQISKRLSTPAPVCVCVCVSECVCVCVLRALKVLDRWMAKSLLDWCPENAADPLRVLSRCFYRVLFFCFFVCLSLSLSLSLARLVVASQTRL